MNSDLCPNCGERRLPKIPEGSRLTARRCQNPQCNSVFPVTQPHPEPEARPDLDEAKK